jgi:hypothetical protein
MYPAIEIDLHLDRMCAAQPPNPAAPEGALRTLNVRHQPAPPSTHPGEGAPAAAIADHYGVPRRTAQGSIGDTRSRTRPPTDRHPAHAPRRSRNARPPSNGVHVKDLTGLVPFDQPAGAVPATARRCTVPRATSQRRGPAASRAFSAADPVATRIGSSCARGPSAAVNQVTDLLREDRSGRRG